jgi:hypothetical protein
MVPAPSCTASSTTTRSISGTGARALRRSRAGSTMASPAGVPNHSRPSGPRHAREMDDASPAIPSRLPNCLIVSVRARPAATASSSSRRTGPTPHEPVSQSEPRPSSSAWYTALPASPWRVVKRKTLSPRTRASPRAEPTHIVPSASSVTRKTGCRASAGGPGTKRPSVIRKSPSLCVPTHTVPRRSS